MKLHTVLRPGQSEAAAAQKASSYRENGKASNNASQWVKRGAGLDSPPAALSLGLGGHFGACGVAVESDSNSTVIIGTMMETSNQHVSSLNT